MCGRYSRRRNADRLAAEFEAELDAQLSAQLRLEEANYNIAPTQDCLVIGPGARTLESGRWGLVPSWSKTDAGSANRINACAETLSERASWRPLLARGRCLVPADGFYEWQQPLKQPFYFRMRGDEPFVFAGLCDEWERPDSGSLKTFTIITTSPNDLVAQVHNRMPAIVERKDIDAWLNPDTLIADVMRMLKPFPASAMEAAPVRPLVNSAKNNGPQLIEPIIVPKRALQAEFNW